MHTKQTLTYSCLFTTRILKIVVCEFLYTFLYFCNQEILLLWSEKSIYFNVETKFIMPVKRSRFTAQMEY